MMRASCSISQKARPLAGPLLAYPRALNRLEERMLTALVIEDDRLVADLIESTLRLQWPDAQVRVVESGMAAAIAAREAEPDLIVIDLGVPTMDALDGLGVIRRFSSASTI